MSAAVESVLLSICLKTLELFAAKRSSCEFAVLFLTRSDYEPT